MTPTNVFLIPLPAGFPGCGRAIAAICQRTNGTFHPDAVPTLEGRNRFRLWVRATEAAA